MKIYNLIIALEIGLCMVSCTVSIPSGGARRTTSAPKQPSIANTTTAKAPEKLLLLPAKIENTLKAKFLDNASTVRIYVTFIADKLPKNMVGLQDFRQNYVLNYKLLPEYGSKQLLATDNIMPTPENSGVDKTNFVLWFDIPKPKEVLTAVLMLEVEGKGTVTQTDVFIRFTSGKVSDYFAVFDKTGRYPQIYNFVDIADTVVVKDIANTQRSLLVFRYKHDFDPALSPMATTPRATTKQLYVDSTYAIQTTKPFVLKQEGLFYFCKDTTESYGIGLQGVDNRFPKLTRPEKLTKPVVYISDNREIAELQTSFLEPKKALDNYWANLYGGNQSTAKRVLKQYYKRVEIANRLFSSYKEGWKTDKGMVFVVMGSPFKIQRTRDREIWTYTPKGVAEINFNFVKRANQFVEDHYELVRYAEYQPYWYPAVEAWRSGDVE